MTLFAIFLILKAKYIKKNIVSKKTFYVLGIFIS